MKKTVLALSIVLVFVNSCKQEDIISPNELISTQACQDHLIAEKVFNDLMLIIQEGMEDNGESKSWPKYNLMNVDTSDIDTLEINFGNENCFHNGQQRRGQIYVTYSGKYRDSYSVIISTLSNYYLENRLIQGEKIITNQGINSDGHMWFTINVNNASIETSNGTIDWQSDIERIWVSGQNTYSNVLDDKYKIIGNSSGNGVNGNPFTMQILDTLSIEMNCLNSCIVKSGTAQISPDGYSNRIINYNDSLCNCNVNVVIDGITYPIVIGD